MKANKVRSAVLEKNQKVVVRDLPEEDLLSSECEVKIKAAGLCSSDISRGYGASAYYYPLVMGHELAGEITRVGIDVVDRFSVGDQVCIFPLIPCFNCLSCDQKFYALCKDYSYFGSRRNGGFAERLNVNQWNLLRIPDGLSIEDCALIEPAAVALHAVEKLNLKIEEPSQICILGAGFIGLIAVQIINLIYPKCKIIIVDRNKYKLDIAAKYGVISQWVSDSKALENFVSENENRFNKVIELIGSPKTFSAALQIASQMACVVWGGNITGDLTLEKSQVSSILRKELTILGTWNSTYKGANQCDWEKTLNLISQGLHPSELVTEKINLEGVDKTLSKLYEHKNRIKEYKAIKIMVMPNG
jgi:L-iditol 2-dehydrogenase